MLVGGKRTRLCDEGGDDLPATRRKFDFEAASFDEPRRRCATSRYNASSSASRARNFEQVFPKSDWQNLPADLFGRMIFDENSVKNARLCCRHWRACTSSTLQILRPHKARVQDAILQKVPDIFSNLATLDLSYCEKLTAIGLENLNRLSGLKSLNLSNCLFVNAHCLASIGRWSRLETLKLAGNRQLVDADLSGLGQASQLATLTLNGCNRLTNQNWPLLWKMTNLQALSLDKCPDLQISEWPFQGTLKSLRLLRGSYKGSKTQGLWQLSQLTQLALNWHSLTPNALLGQVDHLTHLRVLHLYNYPAHIQKEFSMIGKLSNLTNVTLTGCEALTSQLSQALMQLKQLTQVKFRQRGSQSLIRVHWPALAKLVQLDWHGANQVSNANFRSITALKALTSLRLHAFQSVTHPAFAALGGLTKLKYLQLSSFWLSSPKSLHALSELKELQVLIFRSVGACGDWQLTALSRLSRLQKLSFCSCTIANNQIAQIAQLTCVRSLTLSHCTKVKPESFWSLSSLTRCTQLQLEGFRKIESWHLQAFANLGLVSLSLFQTQFLNNRALKALTVFKQLQSLNLGSCRGFSARGLQALSDLNSLKSIDVRNIHLNDIGLQGLAQLLALEEIKLKATPNITLCGLRSLAKLRYLRTLNVGGDWTIDPDLAGLSHVFIARSATELGN